VILKVVIAFIVDDDFLTVQVIGFFYGGQDWESILRVDETL